MYIKIKKVRRYIPNDELITDLLLAAELNRKSKGSGNTISCREYDSLGNFNSSTLIMRFGSWNKAIIEAGLIPVKNRKPSKETLLKNILDVWSKLGRQPKLSEMTRRNGEFSRNLYLKHFGSWVTALEELEKHLPLRVFCVPLCGNKGECPQDEGVRNGIHTSPVSPPTIGGEHKPRTPGIRLRMAVMKRDNFKCVLCGGSPANNSKTVLEIDHIIPWSKGGETTLTNLQTLCSECNNGKTDEAINN